MEKGRFVRYRSAGVEGAVVIPSQNFILIVNFKIAGAFQFSGFSAFGADEAGLIFLPCQGFCFLHGVTVCFFFIVADMHFAVGERAGILEF